MQPISPVIPNGNFNETNIAERQEEYQTLPAIRLEGGVILCRWKLSEEERRRVAETGDIYLLQWTGGEYVTPMLLQVEPPEITQPTPASVQMMTACRRSDSIIEKAKSYGWEIFEDNCSECSFPVVYTSATRDTLADASELKIICKECFKQMQAENPELSGVYLPNTHGEMAQVAEVLKKESPIDAPEAEAS